MDEKFIENNDELPLEELDEVTGGVLAKRSYAILTERVCPYCKKSTVWSKKEAFFCSTCKKIVRYKF